MILFLWLSETAQLHDYIITDDIKDEWYYGQSWIQQNWMSDTGHFP